MNGYFSDWLENLHCLEQLFHRLWSLTWSISWSKENSWFFFSILTPIFPLSEILSSGSGQNPWKQLWILFSIPSYSPHPTPNSLAVLLTLLFKDSNLFSEVHLPRLKPYHFLPSLLQSLLTCLLARPRVHLVLLPRRPLAHSRCSVSVFWIHEVRSLAGGKRVKKSGLIKQWRKKSRVAVGSATEEKNFRWASKMG